MENARFDRIFEICEKVDRKLRTNGRKRFVIKKKTSKKLSLIVSAASVERFSIILFFILSAKRTLISTKKINCIKH